MSENVISLNAKCPIKWIEKYAIDPLTDQNVELFDWQIELIDNMFTKTGLLKKPNWFAFGAKKTGKSALAAMITAYRMFHNRKELYTVMASSESQAFIIYRSFIELFCEAPWFKELKILKNSITHKKNKTELRVLTRAVSSTHGVRPSLLIADELMCFDDKNFQQMATLEASMSLSRSTSKIFLSNVPLFPEHKSLELLKQYRKDKDWQITEFKAKNPDKWRSKRQWSIANPMYDKFEHVRTWYDKEYKNCLQSKQKEADFKRYGLGIGTILDDHRWIDPEALKWVSDENKRNEILNNPNILWTCGWDLSVRGSDSTSWVLAGWEPADDNDPLMDTKLYLFGKIYYGNINKKQSLIRDQIRYWNSRGQVSLQDTDCIYPGPILNDFYNFIDKYPLVKKDLVNVFDPAFSMPYRQELSLEGFVSKTTTYSPKFMTNPIRRLQRLAELKGIYILEKPNEAVKWQAGNGVVSEMSRNWCMLNRLNKNPQLNVDYWSASLLALSELLIPRRKPVIGVF